MPIGQVGFSEAERKMTAQQFISQNCEAHILREFPSEYLNLTLGEIEDEPRSAKRNRCMKLLSRQRYKK